MLTLYKQYCEEHRLTFTEDTSVLSYDNTTLFCPAGMQQFKSFFKNEHHFGTVANVQSCIRLNDYELIGDGTHFGSFGMLGLFSFREWSLQSAIHFWYIFVTKKLGIKLTHVTVHPDVSWWSEFYSRYGVEVRLTEDCKWTDGDIGGYCTEFFVGDLEVGNIVNPLGTCIDVGFGLERLQSLVTEQVVKSRVELLIELAEKIIQSGVKPSNTKQGYVLRRILRDIFKLNGLVNHSFFEAEVNRQQGMKERYQKLKDKHLCKDAFWWFDTHGIDLADI